MWWHSFSFLSLAHNNISLHRAHLRCHLPHSVVLVSTLPHYISCWGIRWLGSKSNRWLLPTWTCMNFPFQTWYITSDFLFQYNLREILCWDVLMSAVAFYNCVILSPLPMLSHWLSRTCTTTASLLSRCYPCWKISRGEGEKTPIKFTASDVCRIMSSSLGKGK